MTLCQISVKLKQYASLAQLFRALPCQGRGRELESLSSHQMVFLLIRLFRAYFYLLLISIKPVVFSPLVFSFPWGTNALFFWNLFFIEWKNGYESNKSFSNLKIRQSIFFVLLSFSPYFTKILHFMLTPITKRLLIMKNCIIN